jgi:hypothetical protein
MREEVMVLAILGTAGMKSTELYNSNTLMLVGRRARCNSSINSSTFISIKIRQVRINTAIREVEHQTISKTQITTFPHLNPLSTSHSNLSPINSNNLLTKDTEAATITNKISKIRMVGVAITEVVATTIIIKVAGTNNTQAITLIATTMVVMVDMEDKVTPKVREEVAMEEVWVIIIMVVVTAIITTKTTTMTATTSKKEASGAIK